MTKRPSDHFGKKARLDAITERDKNIRALARVIVTNTDVAESARDEIAEVFVDLMSDEVTGASKTQELFNDSFESVVLQLNWHRHNIRSVDHILMEPAENLIPVNELKKKLRPRDALKQMHGRQALAVVQEASMRDFKRLQDDYASLKDLAPALGLSLPAEKKMSLLPGLKKK